MTKVKICGLTRAEDVELALECGADALGFVLEPSSPRCVTNSKFLSYLSTMGPYHPPFVAVMGPLLPFVGPFNAVQYSEGLPNPNWKIPEIKVLRISEGMTVSAALQMAQGHDTILLDAFHPNQYGGTGKTLDVSFAAEFVNQCSANVVLAGGLNPANVRESIVRVRPYGVDVSSGVESSPGIKDIEKVRAFVAAARS